MKTIEIFNLVYFYLRIRIFKIFIKNYMDKNDAKNMDIKFQEECDNLFVFSDKR